MHDTDLINQFVELRVQGLSVPKISEEMGLPASTLYDWNERARPRIHKLRLLMVEQVEERVLGAQHAQFEPLAKCLKAIDKQVASQIAHGEVQELALPELIRLGGSLRRQLHRLKIHVTDPLWERKGSVHADPPEPPVGRGVPADPQPTLPMVGRDSVEPNPKP